MSERRTVGVLGANGFVGGRLVEWLVLRELADVRPIVRSYRGLGRLARFDLDHRVADAMDQQALHEQLKGCHVVFHCVVGSRETILKSIEAAYRAAANAGVQRLVYLSSAVVHGPNPPAGTNEESRLLGSQPFEYNVSKVMAEQRLDLLRQDGKLETVVLRPCIVFGPRSQYWTAQLASELMLGKACLFEGGSGICNAIYIDNLVHAMWLAATQPAAANQAFLLTDGERMTWRDLYASVAKALNLDLSGITSYSIEEIERAEQEARKRRRIENLKQSLPARVVKKFLRVRLRRRVRELLNSGTVSMSHADSAIDLEIARLQQCTYAFPITKARSLLGYDPLVAFDEASRRTQAWLRFAFGISTDLEPRRGHVNHIANMF